MTQLEVLTDNIWIEIDNLMNKNNNCNISYCSHFNTEQNQKEGNEVCLDCGEVINNRLFDTCEWNNYRTEDGSFGISSQRGDLYISENPYDKGGSIPGLNKNSFVMRMHLQQTFSHKQKTFWQISEKFQQYCSLIGIHKNVLPTCKDMWHICMESGKLTRASVRNGLISACLYYSCIHNNTPVDRQKLIDITDGNQKGFLKGEKIFMEIMESNKTYKHLGKSKINIKENDTFIKFCSILSLPFETCHICNNVYTENLDKLDCTTPKSITAGILFYVIKNKLKLKQPSKAKISQTVNVCIPTINKVLLILESQAQ